MSAHQILLAFYKEWLQEADRARADSTWIGPMLVQYRSLCTLLSMHLRGVGVIVSCEAKRDMNSEFYRMHYDALYPFNRCGDYSTEMNTGKAHLNKLRYDFVKTQIERLEASELNCNKN